MFFQSSQENTFGKIHLELQQGYVSEGPHANLLTLTQITLKILQALLLPHLFDCTCFFT